MSDHDHDVEYAKKHHLHYDLAGDSERAHSRITRLQEELDGLRAELADALGRIRQLEEHFPADPDDEPDDESWRNTLADYHVASGGADYYDVADCQAVSDAGTQCAGHDWHLLPHRDVNGFEWGEDG